MHLRKLSLTLGLAALAFHFGQAQEVQPPAAGQDLKTVAEKLASIEKRAGEVAFQEPKLFVAGKQVDKGLIDRQLVYIYGRQVMELLKLRILLEEEIARQIAGGADASRFGVLDAEVEAKVEETRKQFKEQYPDLKFEDVLQAQGHTPLSFRLNFEATLKFDKVFLPDNPNEWPEVTKAAIETQGGAEFASKMLDSLKEAWNKQTETGEATPPNPLYQRIMRQWVVKSLVDTSEVKTPIDGIAPEACLQVNERIIRTDEVLPMIEPFIKSYERVQTMKWVGMVEALTAALQAQGKYLTQEQYLAAWKEKYGQYENTPFSPEVIALAFKKFPSMDVYRTYFRLQESYRQIIAGEFDDAHLQAHAEYAKDFLGDGKVDAEVILVSAWNFYANAPAGPDAFEKARVRADECWRRVQAGEDFEKLLDEYSGFIDPPKQQNPQAPPAPEPKKGRFGPQGKNPLKNFLGETEFNSFLNGYSVGDVIFHELEKSEVAGPMLGPYGYYIVKVMGRQPGFKALEISDPSKKELVSQDYLNKRFLDWSNEVLEKTPIEIR
ncbi:MAG: hypothetical protein JNM84_15010 [Planctomycetes bacterium]|nr:hypothetical protein [Planctomycetota bacterium]